MCIFAIIIKVTYVNTCNHSESVHEEVGYPCDKCINKSIKKYKLKTHKEYVNEELIYPCDKCVNKFIKKCKLKTHTDSVHEEVCYPCAKCGNYGHHHIIDAESVWNKKTVFNRLGRLTDLKDR